MSNSFGSFSLKDFLVKNLMTNSHSENMDDQKLLFQLLHFPKYSPRAKAYNINKDYISYKNKKLYSNTNLDKEKEIDKKFRIKMNEKNYFNQKQKQKYIVTRLRNYIPLLSPLPKIEFKRSLRYLYERKNLYKKQEDKNDLAKNALIIKKYDEDNEQFIRSLSYIMYKNKLQGKSNLKSRNENLNNLYNNKEHSLTNTISENEENNKSLNKEKEKEVEKIKITENANRKSSESRISESQNIKDIKDINVNKSNFNIRINLSKYEKPKFNLEIPMSNISIKNNIPQNSKIILPNSTRSKINCKFIFKSETKKDSVEKYNDKNNNSNKDSMLNNNNAILNNINNNNTINNMNRNSLKILDYEYKYDKSLENKIKPKNLIHTFQTKKYNNTNNNTNNNNNNINNHINYYSNKSLPSKIPQLAEVKEFLTKYKDRETIERKYLSNKYIEYILLNKSTVNATEKYYYKINKMYKKQLKEYMKHRINWVNVDISMKNNMNESITINFQWKYYSTRLNFRDYKYDQNTPYKKLRMVNVFEKNAEIGNKKNMFINLLSYCNKININAFDLVPLTIIVSNCKDIDYCLESIKELILFVEKKKLIGKDLITNRKYNEHFWFDKNYENIDKEYIYINKNFLSEQNYWIIKPTDLYQGKCIEISNNYDEIEKKCKNLFRGVDRRIMPEPELLINIEEEDTEDENDKVNTTMINNSGSDNELLKSEIENHNNLDLINSSNLNNSNLNISNNNINSNLNNIMNNFSNSSSTKKSPKKRKNFCRMYLSNEIIIQKYLDHPLLYQKRKFDIRCYVLVDSNLNVYFCREGHLKSSSKFYDLSTNDKFIHITNHSLQKKCSKFAQYEYGNEMSYDDFKKVMKEDNIPLENFDKMIEEMKYLIKISFKSVGPKLMKINPVLCFEIFGYDFILDNDFKPWILEINNNPGLGISSPVILKLVPRMLDDAFRLTIDKIFETKYSNDCIDENGKYKSKYQLDGFTDEENVFEFLCNVK
mgnify:CR=1 FL=1